jgi:hypothetical protein
MQGHGMLNHTICILALHCSCTASRTRLVKHRCYSRVDFREKKLLTRKSRGVYIFGFAAAQEQLQGHWLGAAWCRPASLELLTRGPDRRAYRTVHTKEPAAHPSFWSNLNAQLHATGWQRAVAALQPTGCGISSMLLAQQSMGTVKPL